MDTVTSSKKLPLNSLTKLIRGYMTKDYARLFNLLHHLSACCELIHICALATLILGISAACISPPPVKFGHSCRS